MKIKCDICDKEFEKIKAMTSHRRWHNLSKYHDFQKRFREKASKSMIGKNKGNRAWNKGLTKETDERVRKYGESNIGKHNHKHSNNPNWKGDNAKPPAIHYWIKKNKQKTKKCEICFCEKKLELSSRTHEYKRDLNEYRWLCRSCHQKYDIKKGMRRNSNRS